MQYYNYNISELKPISRNTDDITSHLAEEAIKGKRQSSMERVIECVTESPGRTSRELATKYNLDPENTHKRLSDARSLKLVKKGDKVKCSMSGHLATTWHV